MNRRALLAKIHIARKDLALEEDSYRALLHRVTGKSSAGDMSERHLRAVLDEFKQLGWKPKRGRKLSSKPEVRKIFALWRMLGEDGVVDNPSIPALKAYVRRMTKSPDRPDGVGDPEWLQPEEAYVVIEALKKWKARALRVARKKEADT